MDVGGGGIAGIVGAVRLAVQHQVADGGIVVLQLIQRVFHIRAGADHQFRTLGCLTQGFLVGLGALALRGEQLGGKPEIFAEVLHPLPQQGVHAGLGAGAVDRQRDGRAGVGQRLGVCRRQQQIAAVILQSQRSLVLGLLPVGAGAQAGQHPRTQCQGDPFFHQRYNSLTDKLSDSLPPLPMRERPNQYDGWAAVCQAGGGQCSTLAGPKPSGSSRPSVSSW